MQTHCQRHISFLYSCLLCSVLTRYCLSLIFGLPIRDMFWPDLQLLIRTGLIRLHYWSNCKRYANESWSDMYFTHIWQTPAHSALPGWHLGNFHWFFFCVLSSIFWSLFRRFLHIIQQKSLLGTTNKKSKKFLTKKNFWIFFSGNVKKWTWKFVIFEGQFLANAAGRRTCHVHQMKGLFKDINLVYNIHSETLGNLVKIAFEWTTKHYIKWPFFHG